MLKFLKFIAGSIIGGMVGAFAGIFILVSMLSAFAYMAGGGSAEEQELQAVPSDSVLVVELSSSFGEFSPDSFSGSYANQNIHDFKRILKEASEDDKVSSIILKAGSAAGMGWSKATDVRKALLEFKDSGKSINAFAETLDEKNLYIASVANKIYMHTTGELSWKGLASVPTFYRGLADKLKAKPLVFKAGKYKSAVERYTEKKMSPESRQQIEELLEGVWEKAVREISASRNIDPMDLKSFAESYSVRTSEDAKKVGLVDELSSYTDFLESILLKGEGNAELTEDQVITKKDLKRVLSLASYSGLKHSGFLGSFNSSVFAKKMDSDNKIAVLVLEGAIMSGPSTTDVIGSDTVVKNLQKIRLNKKIKGLVLRVNSPGGSALASDVIWAELIKFSEYKPVYVSMGDVAASGGYYISAGADKIFAQENTITGSIGVFAVLWNLQETMNQKVGFTFDRVATNKYADIGSSVRTMSPGEEDIFNQEVQRVYKNFLTVVEKGRNFTSIENVDNVAQGRVWLGQPAKEAGLVDEIGGLDKAIESLSTELALEDFDVDYYPKKSPIEGFILGLEKFGARAEFLNKMFKLSSDAELGIDQLIEKTSVEPTKVYMLAPKFL